MLTKPHNLESDVDRKEFLNSLKRFKIPQELKEMFFQFLFKPVPTKNKKDHHEHVTFRVHAGLYMLAKEAVANLPDGFEMTMSDLNRGGMILMIQHLNELNEDRESYGRIKKSIKSLCRIEALLNAQAIDLKAETLATAIVKADFTLEEVTEHISQLKAIQYNLKHPKS